MLGKTVKVVVSILVLIALVQVFVWVRASSPEPALSADQSVWTMTLDLGTAETALWKRLHQTAEVDLNVQWLSVVYHHSATAQGGMKSFDDYHRREFSDPNGVKYHFVIGNGSQSGDGEIEISNRWRQQIEAAHNHYPQRAPWSIAINFVGNFEETKPTQKQLVAARLLTKVLMHVYQIPVDKVSTHRIIDSGITQCPGKNFPLDVLKSNLGQ